MVHVHEIQSERQQDDSSDVVGFVVGPVAEVLGAVAALDLAPHRAYGLAALPKLAQAAAVRDTVQAF